MVNPGRHRNSGCDAKRLSLKIPDGLARRPGTRYPIPRLAAVESGPIGSSVRRPAAQISPCLISLEWQRSKPACHLSLKRLHQGDGFIHLFGGGVLPRAVLAVAPVAQAHLSRQNGAAPGPWPAPHLQTPRHDGPCRCRHATPRRRPRPSRQAARHPRQRPCVCQRKPPSAARRAASPAPTAARLRRHGRWQAVRMQRRTRLMCQDQKGSQHRALRSAQSVALARCQVQSSLRHGVWFLKESMVQAVACTARPSARPAGFKRGVELEFGGAAQHQDVEIAGGTFGAACHRPEDQRHFDALHALQCLSQRLHQRAVLLHQRDQRRRVPGRRWRSSAAGRPAGGA